MYLLCLFLHYCFFYPVKCAVRAVYLVATRGLLATSVAVGGYIVGCFVYGVYTGLINL